MNRKRFIRNTILGGLAAGSLSKAVTGEAVTSSTYDKLMQQVGFNHLPLNEKKTMNTVLHKANTRGTADHGWLKANFSFSFAQYYNPERMHFGVLRVLNDDYIAGGGGFATHPHDNMEIITIPLEGGLAHKDSMGNGSVIRKYDIQVMSAGTGILHSEFNASETETANTLQIWLFPNKRNVTPRYDQMSFKPEDRKNKLQQVLSPNADDEGVWIHQDAWFHLGNFEAGKSATYRVKKSGNGIYLFVIKGKVKVGDQILDKRDAYGMWNIDNNDIQIETLSEAEYLIMDVPMAL